jgi:hypothetical protein
MLLKDHEIFSISIIFFVIEIIKDMKNDYNFKSTIRYIFFILVICFSSVIIQ